MRIIACTIFFWSAVPAFAQQSHKQDFRGGNFDTDYLAYSGQTPEKYMRLEKVGLRLRYTGSDVPPAWNTSGVVWHFHARGDFVATARYEILKVEPPKKGWAVGAELYLRVKNPSKDGIAFARVVRRLDGQPRIEFSYLTTNEKGDRYPKDSAGAETTDRSLRGALRLARVGRLLTASFAEADDEFTEIKTTEIGNEDIDQIRFAGVAGGDPNAVLDMRMLEFHLSGKDLGYKGRNFTTPAPTAVVQPANADAPVAPIVVPVQPAVAAPGPAGKTNLLLLVGVFFMLVVPLIIISATIFFLRKS